MYERERQRYEGDDGKHPPSCNCAACTDRRLGRETCARCHRPVAGRCNACSLELCGSHTVEHAVSGHSTELRRGRRCRTCQGQGEIYGRWTDPDPNTAHIIRCPTCLGLRYLVDDDRSSKERETERQEKERDQPAQSQGGEPPHTEPPATTPVDLHRRSEQLSPETAPQDASTCFRHSRRETNLNCGRCGRPICGECLIRTDVGIRCPVCIKELLPTDIHKATSLAPGCPSRPRWPDSSHRVGHRRSGACPECRSMGPHRRSRRRHLGTPGGTDTHPPTATHRSPHRGAAAVNAHPHPTANTYSHCHPGPPSPRRTRAHTLSRAHAYGLSHIHGNPYAISHADRHPHPHANNAPTPLGGHRHLPGNR